MLLLGGIVETGGLILDQARLWHAAREAARIAAVESDVSVVRQTARTAAPGDVRVAVDPEVPAARRRGEPVTVSLQLDRRGRWPVIGTIFDDVSLSAEVTMRIEQP